MGPKAGRLGGEVVFAGTPQQMLRTHTLTSRYLNGECAIEVPACLGAHIYNVIGGEHHVFIMLHHNHGITHIAQLLQRMDKPQIIALVQEAIT